jgi:hypothetical protein
VDNLRLNHGCENECSTTLKSNSSPDRLVALILSFGLSMAFRTCDSNNYALTHFQLLALLSIQPGRVAAPGSSLKLKPVPWQSLSLNGDDQIRSESKKARDLHPDSAAETGLGFAGADIVVETGTGKVDWINGK